MPDVGREKKDSAIGLQINLLFETRHLSWRLHIVHHNLRLGSQHSVRSRLKETEINEDSKGNNRNEIETQVPVVTSGQLGVILALRRINLRDIACEAKTRRTSSPSGTFPDHGPLVPESSLFPNARRHVEEVSKLTTPETEGLSRMDQSIKDLLILHLEGTKHAIEDDEHTTVVAIQVARIATMMDTVMARRVQNVFEDTKLTHNLSMDPELVEKVDLKMNIEETGRNDEGQGKIEHPRTISLNYALSHGSRQILYQYP